MVRSSVINEFIKMTKKDAKVIIICLFIILVVNTTRKILLFGERRRQKRASWERENQSRITFCNITWNKTSYTIIPPDH